MKCYIVELHIHCITAFKTVTESSSDQTHWKGDSSYYLCMHLSEISVFNELPNFRPSGKSHGLYYKLAVIVRLALDSITDIFIYDSNIIW